MMAGSLGLALLIALMITTVLSTQDVCTKLERSYDPCRCCKMQCWFEVNDLASRALGYVPGTQGEEDALNALAGVRECMKDHCTEACLVSKALALANFGEDVHHGR